MKKRIILLTTLCLTAGLLSVGCDNAGNIGDSLVSGKPGTNNDGNSSTNTDDPVDLINAAYENNLNATSCIITFSTGNTYEGDEEEMGGTETDYDKFVITSDAISYETGEIWVTLDEETSETRIDDLAYVTDNDEYRFTDVNDELFSDINYYVYDELTATEYVKNTAELPIDTYKNAFDTPQEASAIVYICLLYQANHLSAPPP